MPPNFKIRIKKKSQRKPFTATCTGIRQDCLMSSNKYYKKKINMPTTLKIRMKHGL